VPDFTDINFEEKCVTEFWSKYPDVLNTIVESPRVSWKEISNIIDELDREFPSLLIASDNPAYDIAHINADLQLKAGVRGLQYRLNESYRNIIDVDSFLSAYDIHNPKMWVWTKKILEAHNITVTANHDHLPENDAMYILEAYLSILNLKRDDWNPFADDVAMYHQRLQDAVLEQVNAKLSGTENIEEINEKILKIQYGIAIISLAEAIFLRKIKDVRHGFALLWAVRNKYGGEMNYSSVKDEEIMKTFEYFGITPEQIPGFVHRCDLAMLHKLLEEYAS
jgi:hypothetical protein